MRTINKLVLAALLCTPVIALAATPDSKSETARVAKAPTAQQQRMTTCNQKAASMKGDERKAFMSSCLRGEAPADAAKITPQQQRMKDCNQTAGERSLKGDERKTFMSSCLKGNG
ncbi:MAG: PsiF family protein [Bdellovibrionota bacterium]